MVSVQWFRSDIKYGLENLHQYGEKTKTKSQKVLGANSNCYRSCRRKTARKVILATPSWIGLILKSQKRFRSKKHNLFTEKANKILLSANDDKRIQSIDSTETYGTRNDLVSEKKEIKCNSIIKQYKNWYHQRKHKRT